MAVVTVKSQQITDRDASPRVPVNGRISGGAIKRAVGAVTLTNGDSIGSIYIAVSVPSNAVVSSVKVTSPDIGTTTAADVGVYQTTQNSNTVVDANFFATALVLNAGAITKSEVAFQSGVYTMANAEKPLWEALGLSADSQRDYDIAMTATGAVNGTGVAILEVEYTV